MTLQVNLGFREPDYVLSLVIDSWWSRGQKEKKGKSKGKSKGRRDGNKSTGNNNASTLKANKLGKKKRAVAQLKGPLGSCQLFQV